jgi:Fur family ferric uptake transcriptional regulator
MNRVKESLQSKKKHSAQELQAYYEIRTQKGLKTSKKRSAVVEYFFTQDRHFTVEQLYNELKNLSPQIGYTTVYRTLKLLVECGLASEHHFGEEDTRYEPIHRTKDHDHLVCQHCGKIIEFTHEGIEQCLHDIARKHNFTIHRRELQIFGICEQCQKSRKRRINNGGNAAQ